MEHKLEIQEISKQFIDQKRPRKRIQVLEDISFSVNSTEILAILGPSGCGKTTLLRIIGGLLRPDSGRVLQEGMTVSSPNSDATFIFQGIDLLPWRTALQNASFGLEIQGYSKSDAYERAQQVLELVGLAEFSEFYPNQLSGGMQQRVGIARALAVDPKILLSDEPFGALDALTREKLQLEFSRIVESKRMTVLFVTHDIDEAIFLADRILVFSPRPASVIFELSVSLPRPRQLPDTRLLSEYSRYRKRLWTILTADVEE